MGRRAGGRRSFFEGCQEMDGRWRGREAVETRVLQKGVVDCIAVVA
jgi:hypothetical protein